MDEKSYYSTITQHVRLPGSTERDELKFLVRVRDEFIYGYHWRQEVTPLVYIYSHESISAMCFGSFGVSFDEMIAEKAERDACRKPPSPYSIPGKAKRVVIEVIAMAFVFLVFGGLLGAAIWKYFQMVN